MSATLGALSAGHVGLEVLRGLREGFFMFWETLWALVLGFALSGAVQAFGSPAGFRAKLGDHRPAAVARASGWGMVSSSCSYAATAVGKSLFEKGADFVSALIFMFASTNLVVELGIVLIVLMGWQFAAGEFVGGTIMIVLLAAVGSAAFGARLVDGARRHLAGAEALATPACAHGEPADRAAGPTVDAAATTPAAAPLSARLATRDGWVEAAGHMMDDLRMLRREIAFGYVVAGLLAVVVPDRVWNALFWHGHGVATTIENVLIGPFIAIISFVCSVGNVPMAAALWSGGISFGGVISFLFADLITFPLLVIYRRLYGGKMALRMLVVFWSVMSLAGLATEALFRALGIIPTHRPTTIAPAHFEWNYTTVLNIVFLGVFAVLLGLSRQRVTVAAGTGGGGDGEVHRGH
ncbi:MAG: permease [Acidimicrobiales bacterium]